MTRNHWISLAFRQLARLFAGPALLLLPTALSAQNFQNLDQLDKLVVDTVGIAMGQPGGPAAPIDRRLHLKPCPSTPEITGPTFGAAIVTCREIGWRLRVPLVSGSSAPSAAQAVANAPAATSQIVIKKGDPVELIAGGPAFTISRQMTADEDGAVGQTIRVREDRRSAPISARVESAGVVRAPTT